MSGAVQLEQTTSSIVCKRTRFQKLSRSRLDRLISLRSVTLTPTGVVAGSSVSAREYAAQQHIESGSEVVLRAEFVVVMRDAVPARRKDHRCGTVACHEVCVVPGLAFDILPAI